MMGGGGACAALVPTPTNSLLDGTCATLVPPIIIMNLDGYGDSVVAACAAHFSHPHDAKSIHAL